MLNSVLKTVTVESGTALDVYLKVALTDARVFLGTVGTKSYTCGHCGRRRMVKSSHADDVRALLVASKLCLECHTSIATDLQTQQTAAQARIDAFVAAMPAQKAAQATFDTHRVKRPETL
jgi:hypothetical protein